MLEWDCQFMELSAQFTIFVYPQKSKHKARYETKKIHFERECPQNPW